MISQYNFFRKTLFCAIIMLALSGMTAAQQHTNGSEPLAQDEFRRLVKTVEKDPADLTLHQQFIKDAGIEDPRVEEQYTAWAKKYPKVPEIPFALGTAYAREESPKAKPWLLKAISADPNYSKAYFDLWLDAERWGDFEGGREFLGKAKEAAPDNPDYNFYYASSFHNIDKEKYRTLSLEVARKFPEHQRGAQALYWLAHRFSDTKERIGYFELLKKSYAPEKFSWSSSGMSGYFDLLLEHDAGKALSLAKEMEVKMASNESQQKVWQTNVANASYVVKAQALLAANKADEAAAMLEQVKLTRWSRANVPVLLRKAAVKHSAGNTEHAYEELRKAYAKEPVNAVEDALLLYGKHLGKTPEQVRSDVRYIRDTAAKVATAFTLKRYLTEGSLSLDELKGKVVLITYWFPGCGPCRGEFPHFENVVRKFKGRDFEYIGINIVPDQNPYVVPFMKSSGYSFTPLEDFPGRDKGNLDNRNAAPVNFLLDKKGRIVFSNFRTDEHNEAVLENMISSLLTP